MRERGDLRIDPGFCLDEAVGRVVPVSGECERFGGFLFESAQGRLFVLRDLCQRWIRRRLVFPRYPC